MTNRYYLLANGLSDFWRRMNIYWKDFMVKLIYFPAYFKLRRQGEMRAQLLATMLVFLTTWALHVYQFFWLQNSFRVTWNDSLFWFILGSAVVVNVWLQQKRGRRVAKMGWLPKLQDAAQIALTFAFISVLWSMWSAPGMKEWLYFLKSGNS